MSVNVKEWMNLCSWSGGTNRKKRFLNTKHKGRHKEECDKFEKRKKWKVRKGKERVL
jgi:hypothetical protein